MNNQIKELVAIGASITANCLPCLEFHVGKARQYGACQQEIDEAITMGKMVRKGASGKMDNFVSSLLQQSDVENNKTAEACGCS